MKIKIILAVVVALIGSSMRAQSIVPFFQEGKKSLKSQFTVMNASLSPMPVSIEAKEVLGALPDGKPIFGPLKDTTKLELRDTSGVVPPKGQRSFDYKLTCPDDCVVIFMTGMTTGRAKDSQVVIKLWLPSGVWICQDKAKDCRQRTKAAMKLE